jgi:hypothetical protein
MMLNETPRLYVSPIKKFVRLSTSASSGGGAAAKPAVRSTAVRCA